MLPLPACDHRYTVSGWYNNATNRTTKMDVMAKEDDHET